MATSSRPQAAKRNALFHESLWLRVARSTGAQEKEVTLQDFCKQRTEAGCMMYTTRLNLLVLFLHIAKLKHTKTLPLGVLDGLLKLLDNLRVCSKVPAGLAVYRSYTFPEKVGVD